MVLSDNAKRLLIYFFYDKDGVVDNYIPYMLGDLQKNVSDIAVVVNGKLTDEGMKTFGKYTEDVFVRENKGFDVWAYKEALTRYGWERIQSYDEVIFMNFTIMGPLYPLSEMFGSMSQRDLDFWGITMFHRYEEDPFGTMKDGFIPDHIQSHFIAVRKEMLKSEAFMKYWDEMPMITGYKDSVGTHEARFTGYFEERGFKWDVYVDTREYASLSNNPVITLATKLISEMRCPIFKRRSFMQQFDVVMNETCGQESFLLFDYIKNHTDYDVNLIWDNLLRVENQADLKKNFQWNYMLPRDFAKDDKVAEGKKIALIMHIYFADLIDECRDFAASMPDNSDLYITTDTEEKAALIRESFSKLTCNKLEVLVCENKGADVGPLLVEFADRIDDYDYICHAHDKKAGQNRPGTIGTSFAYRCFENLLPTKEYVKNVISVFEENERVGLLTPPPPNHADYYITLGLEWSTNYENTVALAKELGLKAPMSEKKEPIAPLGGFFFARAKALKPLFAKHWQYEEFVCTKGVADGTIAHAIERIYPFVVQSEGYYPGWIMSDRGAAMELTNLNYMLHAINDIIFNKGQDAGSFNEVLTRLNAAYDIVNHYGGKGRANNYLDSKLYIATPDSPFKEETAIEVKATGTGEEDRYSCTIGLDGKEYCALRFDPCEYGEMVVEDFVMKLTDTSGSIHTFTQKEARHNALLCNAQLVYIVGDPQLGFTFKSPICVKEAKVSFKLTKSISPEIVARLQQKTMGIIKNVTRRL